LEQVMVASFTPDVSTDIVYHIKVPKYVHIPSGILNRSSTIWNVQNHKLLMSCCY